MATDETNVATGGVVKPVYSERTMRCLTVSESELKQLSLSNWGVTIFAAIGSALFTFGVDLLKDTALAPPADRDDLKAAIEMADTIETLCLGGGVVCFAVAAGLLFWRRDMLKTIREESGLK